MTDIWKPRCTEQDLLDTLVTEHEQPSKSVKRPACHRCGMKAVSRRRTAPSSTPARPVTWAFAGGRWRARTADPLLVRQVLYRLS